ncbi:MAG: endonuclease MutS2 [candidate division Zixibacteria bacterium]|nr:endonuclease MutS2 [candidate division Zixibacteria bacterium]
MIDKHTIKVLEFGKVLNLIAGKTLTLLGKEQVLRICPLFDKAEIESKLTEISQMKDILNFGDPFPLVRIEDPREIIKKATVPEIFLEPSEFLLLKSFVMCVNELHGFSKDEREHFPVIDNYLTKLRAFPELIKDIDKTIDDSGEIKDSASKELRKLRNELIDKRRSIQRLLDKILSGSKKQSGAHDDIITQRNGRYVITIPSNMYRSDIGILQDRSQSGATLYVEPKEAVDVNNRIILLQQEERLEIIRILKVLTKEVAERSSALAENAELIGAIDRIHACANYSNEIKGAKPAVVEDAEFEFINARHPLLIEQFEKIKDVIPADISLDNSRQAILVTGPNTGGKTIIIKTVGLLLLMAQSGLHISADEKSTAGIFKNIFVDIGDEQSIEQSLSTFSSHINNIIRGLENVSTETLYLFDEIGAGTDPKEGAALAEAIILYAVKSGARLIATTHYSQLKTLPQHHPEIENASLEFNKETLEPTYRLQLGLPGSSYAVEISKRLGMPQEICNKALGLIGSGERSLTALIGELEAELGQVRLDKIALNERLEQASELESEYKTETTKLKKETDKEKEKALSETAAFLDTIRRDIERLVAEIRKSQASKESLKEFHNKMKKAQEEVKKRLDKMRKEPSLTELKAGDRVHILTLNKDGEIEQLLGNDKAKIKIGNIITTVELRNLSQSQAAPLKSYSRARPSAGIETSVSPEIHLRGMTVEEALEKLDKYLDQAVVAGLGRIYVIHGKGTGKLRRRLSDFLKQHPEVDSIRLGDWNEGGAGVTVVKLKD